MEREKDGEETKREAGSQNECDRGKYTCRERVCVFVIEHKQKERQIDRLGDDQERERLKERESD